MWLRENSTFKVENMGKKKKEKEENEEEESKNKEIEENIEKLAEKVEKAVRVMTRKVNRLENQQPQLEKGGAKDRRDKVQSLQMQSVSGKAEIMPLKQK